MCLPSFSNVLGPNCYHTRFHLVPDDTPQNVNASSYTPTSITVCFEYPEGSTQNGLITSFNVTLIGSPFDKESQTVSIPVTSTNYPLTGSMCGDVTNLQEYNSYNITAVVLINDAGSGPSYQFIQVRTLQAGKFQFKFRLFSYVKYIIISLS